MNNEAAPYDPLLREVPLPLVATYYALGFAVEVATNSAEVLEAAAESWGGYQREFESRPVRLRVIVQAGGDRAPEPVVRTQEHYFSVVADRENFGAYDSATFFGYCYLNEATAADRPWFRFHFLETMAYMLLAQRYVMPLHAACVARNDVGVLLYGHSGAGKSTLAWACARAGWTYVADDGAWLLPDVEPPTVLGRCRQIRFKPDAPRLFPELGALVARLRPDGKRSIEVPVADFPAIRTASRTRVDCVVDLDRRSSVAASISPADSAELAALLANDMPRYGDEVRARYDAAIAKLLRAPCYRLTYDKLDDAVELLAACTERME